MLRFQPNIIHTKKTPQLCALLLLRNGAHLGNANTDQLCESAAVH